MNGKKVKQLWMLTFHWHHPIMQQWKPDVPLLKFCRALSLPAGVSLHHLPLTPELIWKTKEGRF